MAAPDRVTTIILTGGQITLPKAVREAKHWRAGTRLTLEDIGDGIILRSVPFFPLTTIDEVFGALGREDAALSLEDMETAVAAEAKRVAQD